MSDALTHAQDIQDLMVIANHDIAGNLDLWTRTAPPTNVAAMTNPEKRMLCYRKLFRVLHGIGRLHQQLILPSCCRAPIDRLYAG